MQVGDLVKHTQSGYIGILVKHGGEEAEYWLVHWGDANSDFFVTTQYYSECELEVICK